VHIGGDNLDTPITDTVKTAHSLDPVIQNVGILNPNPGISHSTPI
jgi:hypothetical protein